MDQDNHIAAVIFDLDGLMVDTERYSFNILREYAAEYDISLTREDYARLIGQDSTSSGIFLHEEIGIPVVPEKIMDDHWARLTEVISREAQPMPGLYALIDALRARQLPLAVASNSRLPYIELALAKLEVRQAFQCVFSGQVLARSKPAPDVYLETAKCLGLAPARCLALEDSRPGMQSALAAGMRCVVVPNMDLQEEDFSGAFARYQSLHEVHANLERLLG